MSIRILISVILGAFACSNLHADEFDKEKLKNWHHWRGPEATGFAPKADPPETWDDTKNIKWKAELPGRGSATPIVWGDRVFIATAAKTDKKIDPDKLPKVDPRFEKKTERPLNYYQFLVLAFDRETGKELWRTQVNEAVPHEGHHETHSYAAGSPTTDGKNLFVSFGSYGTYCLNFDGKILWKRDLGNINSRLGWGEAVTPVVHGESLVLNWDQEADSKVICLNTKDGETRWSKDRDDKTSWNTPLIAEGSGKPQVVLNGTNRVRSYSLETGAEIWSCPGMTVNAIPSPVTDGKNIFVMSGYRGAAAIAVPASAKGELKPTDLLWQTAKGTPYVPSPLLLNDRLYFTQANTQLLTILNTKTGETILDRDRLPAVRDFYGSPAAAAGKIYLVDRDGVGLVLKLADKVEVISINRLKEPVDASPVLVGKQLFLRGDRHLFCVEEK